MSASDPTKGFPNGDRDGDDRPAEPADASAEPARPGADPAPSADPADPARPPEAGAADRGEQPTPPPHPADPDAAAGGDPAGADPDTAPWRSAVANRPPRAQTGETPDPGEPEASGAPAGGHAPTDPMPPVQHASGAHPGEPGTPGTPGTPDAAGAPGEPGAPEAPGYPGTPGQPGAPGQPGGFGPAGHEAPGVTPGQGGPYGPYGAPPPGHAPGQQPEAAAWSGSGPGGPGHPGGPYGPGPGPAPGQGPGGGHFGAGGYTPGGPAHPGGPGYGGYPPPPGEGHPLGHPGEQPPKEPFLRRNKVVVIAAATALVTSLIVGPAAAGITAFFAGGGGTTALTDGSEGSVSSGSVSKVADKALPSVVSIQAGQGSGSGVVISSDGKILTNAHVVSAAEGEPVTVAFNDGSEAEAEVLGSDPVSDLAVIQAEGKSGLTTAALGDSDKVEVGADVVAIGSPLGLQGTVTSGVVSAMDRPVNTGVSGQEEEQQPQNPFGLPEEQPQQPEEDQLQTSTVINAIQTDAPINPGNSGGPLMNMSGEVIGINTAIASTSGGMGSQAGSIGLGFAIPVNQAKPIAQQLIEDGQANYAAIEATITGQQNAEGATVVETNEGGAAAQAGLERGDRITTVDGKPVEGPNALIAAIRSHQPGDTITIGFVRDGQEQEAEVTLSAQSSESIGG